MICLRSHAFFGQDDSRWNFGNLRYFLAVAEALNFTNGGGATGALPNQR